MTRVWFKKLTKNNNITLISKYCIMDNMLSRSMFVLIGNYEPCVVSAVSIVSIVGPTVAIPWLKFCSNTMSKTSKSVCTVKSKRFRHRS